MTEHPRGLLRIYSGTQPTDSDQKPSDQTLLAELDLSSTFATAASPGSAGSPAWFSITPSPAGRPPRTRARIARIAKREGLSFDPEKRSLTLHTTATGRKIRPLSWQEAFLHGFRFSGDHS